jgi:hypothetical protein
MRPVAEVLRAIVGEKHRVYSYRANFAELWDQEFIPSSGMVIVFDGVPQSIAEHSGLNLADRVTIVDWLAWMSLRSDASGFSVMVLDLAGHQHPAAFGVRILPLLLPDLPWVRVYRVFGTCDERQLLKFLQPFGADSGRMAAQLGRGGYGLERLLADLGLVHASPVPLPLAEVSDRVRQLIRELWVQSLTRAHGRHEVANLIGPLILADELAYHNDRGARQLAKSLKEDSVTAAFCRLLCSLGLLRDPLRELIKDEKKPLAEELGLFPSGNDDTFGRFGRVRFLLVDDQVRLGYGKILSAVLTGEPNDPFDSSNPAWQECKPVSLAAESHPERLIRLLESEASSEEKWATLKTLGQDTFDILVLDLRLFPESDVHRASDEETRFLERLTAIGRKIALKCVWTERALEAAKKRLEGQPENPLQWALLPLLLSEADPSLPIVIFSSTHQRDIAEALHSMPNVVTDFAKPLPSEYGEAGIGRVRTDLRTAVKRALELHEKRAVWMRFAALANWGRPPIYEVVSYHDDPRVYNYEGTPPDHARRRGRKRDKGIFKWKPRLRGTELQQRLAAYYRDHLLWEQYIESLSTPFELFEECLVPDSLLDDLREHEVSLWFEQDIDSAHNPIAKALGLIRHKKNHGHARHGGMKLWEEWGNRTRLVAVILLFLCDYIEQRPPGELHAALSAAHSDGAPPTLWEQCCMRVGWKLLRDARVRLLLDPTPGKAYSAEEMKNMKIRPQNLTTERRLDWEDVTTYTLALACRDVAGVHEVNDFSWQALQRLILSSSTEALRLGQVKTKDLNHSYFVILGQDGKRVSRPPSCYFPGEPQLNAWVLYADSDREEDRWVLGPGCLPDPELRGEPCKKN